MKTEPKPLLPIVVKTLRQQDSKEINLKLLCKEVYKQVEPLLCRAHSDMNLVLKQIWTTLGECQRQKIVDFKSYYSDDEDDEEPSTSSERVKINAQDSLAALRKKQKILKRLKSKSRSTSSKISTISQKKRKSFKH